MKSIKVYELKFLLLQDMSQIYESLKVLNATLSHLTSVCLFIFITTSISCKLALHFLCGSLVYS